MHHLVCITGLVGSGKSVVSDYFVNHEHYQFIRLGQLVIDEVIKRGLPLTEANQKSLRDEFRHKHGLSAMVILNLEKIQSLIKQGNVIIDNLMSYEEFQVLKENFGNQLTVITVYAPPALRYDRVSKRKSGPEDKDLRNHEFTPKEAHQRDLHELGKLNKGTLMALADFTLINTGDIESLHSQIREVISTLS